MYIVTKALQAIFPYADDYCDSGPAGYGWQSNKQQVILEQAKAAIQKAISPNPIH